jgi:hypothetical protein
MAENIFAASRATAIRRRAKLSDVSGESVYQTRTGTVVPGARARDNASYKLADPVTENLILDLLEFLSTKERSYEEVMDAWRTSCPKLPVWEDANDRGLVATDYDDGRAIVRVTAAGAALLAQTRGRG